MEINHIHRTPELIMEPWWAQGPRWSDSNSIQFLCVNTHTQNTKVMVNQTRWPHGLHIQTLSHCTHIDVLSFTVSLSLYRPHSLSLSLSNSLTNSSRLSQVELKGSRGFAFVFFQYLLWTEDHRLTKGEKKRSRQECSRLSFVKDINFFSSCSFHNFERHLFCCQWLGGRSLLLKG